MKQFLLLLAITALASFTYAQKKQTEKKPTAYAITGVQKGQSGWTEVRLVDLSTGEEIQTIYQNGKDVQIFNARTGKPIEKKDLTNTESLKGQTFVVTEKRQVENLKVPTVVAPVNTDATVDVNVKYNHAVKTDVNSNIRTNVNTNVNTTTRVVMVRGNYIPSVQSDKPFATSSAACAYDKKHERLYYTPMNIAQLRYIDLKTGKFYYFEGEDFGVLKSRGDVGSQITRMVMASDGNGYALTNDANHLIQFTTDKKATITDLGALTDDAANGSFSVHNPGRFGGDIIADANKNLYLIGADRTVYKISLDTKLATYLGSIQGLPRGFSTNGAVAEGGSSVIVTSSTSTVGYYKFDLNTLQAEKVSESSNVYNASDLANGTFAFDKEKKKKEKKVPEVKQPDVVIDEPVKDQPVVTEQAERKQPVNVLQGSISIYPNPVTEGVVKLSFADQLPGKYQIEFMDVTGRTISAKQVSINNKVQVEEFRLPELTAKGNYLMRITSEATKASTVNKLVVQ